MKILPADFLRRERARLLRIVQRDRLLLQAKQGIAFGFNGFNVSHGYAANLVVSNYNKTRTQVRINDLYRETVMTDAEFQEEFEKNVARIDGMIFKAAYSAVEGFYVRG